MKVVTKKTVEIDNEGTGARARRERGSISLRKVASRVGISASYLSDLELGRRNWSEELVEKVSSAIASLK